MSSAEVNGVELFDRIIGVGQSQRVGRFRYFFSDERWEWSHAVARMHGYDETTSPTTELLLRHKHPDDLGHVEAALDRVMRGEPFSSRHRIVDTNGHTRWVIVVGDRMLDGDTIIGTSGFYIDVTESFQSDITTAVSELAASRAEIEQAKGVLITTYGITADSAFEILVWRSQETNVKVRELARQFMADVARVAWSPDTTRQIDHILLGAAPRRPH